MSGGTGGGVAWSAWAGGGCDTVKATASAARHIMSRRRGANGGVSASLLFHVRLLFISDLRPFVHPRTENVWWVDSGNAGLMSIGRGPIGLECRETSLITTPRLSACGHPPAFNPALISSRAASPM